VSTAELVTLAGATMAVVAGLGLIIVSWLERRGQRGSRER
jgi:hypothetical protein